MEKKTVAVYADWPQLGRPHRMGLLTVTPARGKEIFSFAYDEEWMAFDQAQWIDPDLQFYIGSQYPRNDKSNFGIFLDSSPDRWGRILMRRREAAIARKEGRKPGKLFESDYLLGVFDESRMGALRFKVNDEGSFVGSNRAMAAPPWASLRDLEYASLQLEREDAVDDPDYLSWLNMLLAPGSSLGGARPKASVLDLGNHLWIAKFPSQQDDKDTGAWEMAAHALATRCGITMAEAQVKKFSHHQHTFLTKRFDRKAGGARLHFASAMTMLGYTDGTDHQDGVSYLELVEFLTRHGGRVKEDLKELWTRIVFSICISNTDDHLRNHGFMLTPNGWVLSPAYDINPIESGNGLKLNINEYENALDLDLAREVGPYFRLKEVDMDVIIDRVTSEVSRWREVATALHISRNEQERMEVAFWS